jgi:hypothetical protein
MRESNLMKWQNANKIDEMPSMLEIINYNVKEDHYGLSSFVY